MPFIDKKPNPTLKKIIVLLSFILYILSLTQPSFYIDRADDPEAWSDSLSLVIFGWMSIIVGNIIAFFFWLANPIYLSSIILTLRGKKSGLYLSALASIIALGFSLLPSIMSDEAGNFSKITSLELGYKLWLMSLLTMTVGTAFNNYKLKK